MPGDDDWRLQGQERFLTDRQLKWMTWHAKQPSWDHDHCAFCWAKISDFGRNEAAEYEAAWVTADDEYHWVCPPCFDDFRERFGWTAVGDPPPN